MNAPRDSMAGVDPEHPWIGLASFTESSRGYFHGRDEEIGELCRRIQRKPLTVLFGQSGLGKTSILQAGVVPRLRGQGYCPIYLRIDYADSAPSAEEQIKQAIMKAAEQSGRWTRAGVADEGESLWAFLHHRDDVLIDSQGQPLLPLLIFDQFEEIFTLAQADEQGRERAAAFTADLADLIENRPPAALEALLEQDDDAYERYDLARADYRVVISLREDYLAHLEGLKAAMPSITQNRLRLAPMTGAQALSAIIEPGRHLVNDEAAAAIVRFVAGGAEVAHAEVEPSLLSLICRELNDQRIALGRPEIGADLLAGSHTSILGEFYERSVADQPVGMRNFIEDHLLTDSGYRENVAEERVRSEFAAAGAQPDALALLVNRRLLRIEERLDLRRVELTHDVLCAVVRASRDQRREREALEASERLAANQAERARLAQRALKRARTAATVCILLAVGAVAASGFAVVSSRRAQQAERDAQATRARAEQLLSYLQNDFAAQLVPLGRLDLVQSLDDRIVTYFEGVPDDQRTPEWAHSRALALLAQAETRIFQGHATAATVPLDAALSVLELRGAEAHRSAGDLAELARGLLARSHWLSWGKNQLNEGLVVSERAAKLLDDSEMAGQKSQATRMVRADINAEICYAQVWIGYGVRDAGVASCESARREYSALGALSLRNPVASVGYLRASWLLIATLTAQGRADEVLPIGEQSRQLGAELVSKDPAYSNARDYLGLVDMEMARLYRERLDLVMASKIDTDAETALAEVTVADPTKADGWNDLALVRMHMAKTSWERGNPEVAVVRFGAALDTFQAGPHSPFNLGNAAGVAEFLASAQADRGDEAALKNTLARRSAFLGEIWQPSANPSQDEVALRQCNDDALHADLATTSSDGVGARQLAEAGLARVAAVHFKHPDSIEEDDCRATLWWALGRAQYRAGDAVGAQEALRRSIKANELTKDGSAANLRWLGKVSTWLALAQIRQGDLVEARATLAPVLALHRSLTKLSTESAQQRLEMAAAWYAQALAEPTQGGRLQLLKDASGLVDGLPAAMHGLHSFQLWRGWISRARNGSDTWPPKDSERD